MLRISAVWPPEPRTTRRWVGWTEGGGRQVGLRRERIEARRKKVRLTMRTRATRERRKVVWEGERSVSCERPSRSKREDIVQREGRGRKGVGSDRLLCPLCFLYLRQLHFVLTCVVVDTTASLFFLVLLPANMDLHQHGSNIKKTVELSLLRQEVKSEAEGRKEVQV